MNLKMSGTSDDLQEARAEYLAAKGQYLSYKNNNNSQTGGAPKTSKKIVIKPQKEGYPFVARIVATPGSGKTTLGRRLAAHSNAFIVIEMDDIYKEVLKELLENRESPEFKRLFDPETDLFQFSTYIENELTVRYDKIMDKILAGENPSKKVVVNISSHMPLSDKTYVLDASPEQIYRQYTLRTIKSFHENYAAIEDMLKNEPNLKVIDVKLHSVYATMRDPIPLSFDHLVNTVNNYHPEVARYDKKAVLMKADDIFDDLVKISKSL